MNRGKINYFGWLGHQNLGDEALYACSQTIFNRYNLVPYGLGIDAYNQSGYPITIFGGGTVLPDWAAWLKPSKYNYVFGSGVRNPIFWGSFDSIIIKRLKSFDFRLIGVRGNISKRILENWGINSEVIGDPCLSLKANSHVKREEKKIVINVGTDGLLWGQNEKRVFSEITKVCQILKNEGFHPILVPFHGESTSCINEISRVSGVPVFNDWFNITSALNLIASCKILIGEKLHSLVFSASTFTPFICLEYRPKCFDFSESVGFAKYSIRTDRVTAKSIMKMFDDLMSEWRKMHVELARRVSFYREKQKKFADRIIADIESLPDNKFLGPSFMDRTKYKIFWHTDYFIHKKMSNVWRIYNRLVFLHIIPILK